jgi:hypothetical protein
VSIIIGFLVLFGAFVLLSTLLSVFRAINSAVTTAFDRVSSISIVFGIAFAVIVFLIAALLTAYGALLYWDYRKSVLEYWLPRLRRQPVVRPDPAVSAVRLPGLIPGTIGALIVASVLVLSVGSVAASAFPQNPGALTAAHSGDESTAVPANTPTPAATPTSIPTETPLPPTPVPPTPKPCTTLNCNPWGYSFSGTTLTYNPPSAFCSYFACIANFWNGNGYVVECADERYSKSGGIQGACSQHGGVFRPLYAP